MRKSIVLFFAIFSVITIAVFYQLLKVDTQLKIYNPSDVNPRLVDESVRFQKKNHKTLNFELINQKGEKITQKDYKNKIYVADFFFTRCQSICIPMAYNMSQLQEFYKNDNEIMFLSHSVTPKMDSISVLRKYADEKGVIDGKWNVTTGDKKHIYDLARKSYFVVTDEGSGDENDFIHTENFVLVDKERRLRGFYDGTKVEEMERLKEDIAILKVQYARK